MSLLGGDEHRFEVRAGLLTGKRQRGGWKRGLWHGSGRQLNEQGRCPAPFGPVDFCVGVGVHVGLSEGLREVEMANVVDSWQTVSNTSI